MKKGVGPAIAGIVLALLFFAPSVWLAYVEASTSFFRDHNTSVDALATFKRDNEVIFDYLLRLLTALVTPAAYLYLRRPGNTKKRASGAALTLLLAIVAIVLLQGVNLAIVHSREAVLSQFYGAGTADLLASSVSADLQASLGLLLVLLGIRGAEELGGR